MDLQQILSLMIVAVAASFLGHQAWRSWKTWRVGKWGCGGGCGKCAFASKSETGSLRPPSLLRASSIVPLTSVTARPADEKKIERRLR